MVCSFGVRSLTLPAFCLAQHTVAGLFCSTEYENRRAPWELLLMLPRLQAAVALAVQSFAGMKSKHSGLLRTFYFRFFHHLESVCFLHLILKFVLPASRECKRLVEGISAFMRSPIKLMIALILCVMFPM